jgi:hypothetical protein
MFSELHPSHYFRQPSRQPYGQSNRQPYRQPYGDSNRPPYRPSYDQRPPRPFVQEDTLKAGELQIERKFYDLTLKENAKGRFLRITESAGGRRNVVIIPASGLKEFQKLLADMVAASGEIPAKSQTAPIG